MLRHVKKLCRVFGAKPADEPVASLDPVNAQAVIGNLHGLDCDGVIGSHDGRMVFGAPPDQLTTAVETALGVPVKVVTPANYDGLSRADSVGNWDDGYSSGAFRKAADAGLRDRNNLLEIWRSALTPKARRWCAAPRRKM